MIQKLFAGLKLMLLLCYYGTNGVKYLVVFSIGAA